MSKHELVELISKSCQKDYTAFQKLVETHQYLVYKLAFRVLGNQEDAKDIVQETFIKVWNKLNTFKHEYKFSTWLYRITSNLCYDLLKSKKYQFELKSKEYSNIADNIPDTEYNGMESNDKNKHLIEQIRNICSDLSPKQRLVFTLKDIEGLDTDEITEITGLSPGKIKSNLYMARKNIKAKLNGTEL